MDEIQIFDNFFDNDIFFEIIEYFQNCSWKTNCINRYRAECENGDKPFWYVILDNDTFFNLKLKSIVETKIGRNIEIERLYAVGQSYCQTSKFHQDSNKSNFYTLCLYISPQYELCDGNFYIKLPDSKVILSVEPKVNRCILFPSHYIHKGDGYISNTNLRICVAWKFSVH